MLDHEVTATFDNSGQNRDDSGQATAAGEQTEHLAVQGGE